MDDSEYTTRLNRLDGLIAQLAFSIRKSWKAVPLWLAGSVNKDAIQTGKQEMTAAGRAFISCWLVDEVFDKYFHPDLDPNISAQLKSIQRNIKRYAPPSQTMEEDEQLAAKVIAWRLATVDGLQDVLRASQSTGYRAQLTESLKQQLIGSLQIHLSDPPISDLEGGVNMIIELAVSLMSHIPIESRDVQIEYYMPGTHINEEYMKVENGIPSLGISVHEDVTDGTSLKSTAESEDHDVGEQQHQPQQQQSRSGKRNMLTAAFVGGKKGHPQQQGKSTGSTSGGQQQQRPDSAGKEDAHPKVRMAVGLASSVRGKSVLTKASVHST